MKLSIITNSIPAYRKELFHILSKKYDLSIYLSEHGTQNRNWSNEEIENAEVYIVKMFSINFLGITFFWPKSLPDLKDSDCLILSDSIQMIVASLFLVLSPSLKNIPIVLWSSYFGNKFHRESESIIKRFITICYENAIKVIARKSNAIICYSEAAKLFLLDDISADKKIYVGTQTTHNKMPINGDPNKARNKYNVSASETIVVICSYLTFRKGVDKAIEVIDHLGQIQHTGYQILIAGTGVYQEKIEEISKGKTNIKFLGYLQNEDLSDVLACGDIFVDLTRYDPGGWTVFEAALNKLAVITTQNNANGLSFISHGISGHLIANIDDTSNIALVIHDLINNFNKRQSYGENLYQTISNLPIEFAVQNFERAINTAVTEKRQ